MCVFDRACGGSEVIKSSCSDLNLQGFDDVYDKRVRYRLQPECETE